MTRPPSQRSDMPDDLDQAYAQAHALADGERAPAASVRAHVLAAAREIAAQAAARAGEGPEAKPVLVPVAPPVTDVARGRSWALNLSSWRMRSGAALCAALLVALGTWRFDARRSAQDGVMVASLDKSVEAQIVAPVAQPALAPRDLPPPQRNLPAPPMMAPSPEVRVDAPPTETVASADAAARAETLANRAAARAPVVVAQADVAAPVARSEARVEGYRPPSAMAPPRAEPREPTLVAMAPPVYVPAPAPAPAPLERRIALAPPAPAPAMVVAGVDAPAPPAAPVAGFAATAPAPSPAAALREAAAVPPVTLADAAPQRVEIAGSRIASVPPGSDALRGSLESAKKAAPPGPVAAALGGSLRALPAAPPIPLLDAASQGDLAALQKLLADPQTRVDASDARGRTALTLAVMQQHVEAVRLLLAAGADADHVDRDGATPRSLARTGASAEIAAFLSLRR